MQSYCWREMLIISEKNYIRYDLMKNSLSDEQKNALKYVANAEKRGIIEKKRKKNDNKSETMPKKHTDLLKLRSNKQKRL